MPDTRVTFLYFDGCANSAATLENLRTVLAERGELQCLETIEVTPETYERADPPFAGSPSVYVNGIDLYSGDRAATPSFSCRTFEISGERTGVLPEPFIRRRLDELLSSSS